MIVIGLSGDVNTGKSHVINIVYQFLLNRGFSQVPGVFRILGNPKFEDVFDVLQNDKIKVGIIGMGDYQKGSNSLKSLLAEIENLGCDIAICACRTNPKIEQAVTNYPNHHLLHKTVTSADPSIWRIDNNIDANRIVNLV